MTLFAVLVCIAVLFTVGYFLFAVLGEVAFWLYNRSSNQMKDRAAFIRSTTLDL